jgi:hypothetical protein
VTERPSITGVWDGLYIYPRIRKPVPFLAVLLGLSGALSGTTQETPKEGRSAGCIINAEIVGTHRSGSVSFRKTYLDAPHGYNRPVEYAGALNADGTEIEGHWTIAGLLSGKFLMIRSGSMAIEQAEEKLERIPMDAGGPLR